MSRFKNTLYKTQEIIFQNHRRIRIQNEDGTLFSGSHKTKILPGDLPKWYIEGMYYRCHGYLSVKGITNLVYIPNKCFNHFLKDDYLFISYSGKTAENGNWDRSNVISILESEQYDHIIRGSVILKVIKGAREYSDYNITSIIEQIKDKRLWLKETFTDDLNSQCKEFDIDAYFA